MPKNKNYPIKGFAHILLLIAVVGLIGFAGSIITTKQEFPQSSVSQNVLGENEEIKEVEKKAKEAAKKAEEQQKEIQKAQEEIQKKQKEQQKKSAETKSSEIIKSKTEGFLKSKFEKEGQKSETEIETADGQKIKTKVEDDGTTKVEVEHGQLKLKYEVKNGAIKLKAENEQGQEVELEDEELEEVEHEIKDKLEEKGIKISTGSGKPILLKNNVAALTDFPLSVDVGTNQLIVTTPGGQKVVTVLPDQAVQNLLATNIINKIEQISDTNLTSELGNLSGVVKLEIRNNEVVYKVKGTKKHNLLGFIPIYTAKTVFASTGQGQPVAQEQTLLANIIDLLSP